MLYLVPTTLQSVKETNNMGSNNVKLRNEDIETLVKVTGLNEEEIKTAFNNFLERNPNGKLTEESFKKLLTEARPNQDVTSIASHCFRMFDRNKNGEIDFIEFMIANTFETAGKPEEKMKQLFNLFDVNGDKKISMEEMQQLIHDMLSYFKTNKIMENLSDDASVKFTKTIFSQMDKNNDGSISQAEFVRQCLADDHFRSLIFSFWPQNVNVNINKK